MKSINKFLSLFYFLTILLLPNLLLGQGRTGDHLFIYFCFLLFYFSCLHWTVSVNLTNTKSEKIFTIFSIINLTVVIIAVLSSIFNGYSEFEMLLGFITAYAFLTTLPVTTILSILFGLISLFKSNRKFFNIFLIFTSVLITYYILFVKFYYNLF